MQYRKSNRSLVGTLAAAAIVLTACGGGGDDGSADPTAQADAAGAVADNQGVTTAPQDGADAGGALETADAGAATEAADTNEPVPEEGDERDPTSARWEPSAEDGSEADLAAAAEIEREEAMATTYRRPKIAAIDYTKTNTTTRRAHLARFNYVLLGLSKSMGASTMNSMTSDIKARNPNVKIAHYTIVNEVKCSATSADDYYDLYQMVQKTNWWLRTGSGTRSQWTTTYSSCDINLTSWGPKNSAGQTWAEYKWSRDWNVFFKNMPNVEYVHVDNLMRQYRKDADFKRAGYNQDHDDPYYASKWRQGMMKYVERIRYLKPGLKVSVNADNDLSYSEYVDKVDMAFLEGVVGKSWSKESRSWTEAMNHYRKALANAKGSGNAIFQAFSYPSDYKLIRYSLASAMLEDGYFMQTNLSGGQLTSWFDEFNARIGAPIEPPPTKAKQNGIWMRKYENGLVLVNPSKTSSASIYVGSGYKRLTGTQDPAVNNGKVQSTVTLAPRSGLLMLRS